MKTKVLLTVSFLSVGLIGCEPREGTQDLSNTNAIPSLTPGTPSATNFPGLTNQPGQVNQPPTNVSVPKP